VGYFCNLKKKLHQVNNHQGDQIGVKFAKADDSLFRVEFFEINEVAHNFGATFSTLKAMH
jgi:hypothetical protein